MEVRYCSGCKMDKDTSAFFKRTDRPWLYLSLCKQCRNSRRRTWEKQNPTKVKQERQIRNSTRRGACSWCWNTKGSMSLFLIDNKTGLYHDKCASELQQSLDDMAVKYV